MVTRKKGHKMFDKAENAQNRKYIYLFLVVLLCVLSFPKVISRRAEKLFREVLELQTTGRYDEALPKINRAIRLRPRNESYLSSRAVISFVKYRQTRSEEFLLYLSIADWLRVIELKQKDPDWRGWSAVYRNLGLAYQLSGEVRKSIKCLRKALSYNTMDLDLSLQISAIIGDLYFENKNYVEAADWYAKIPSNHGSFFHSCRRGARSNHQLDNFERAEELYLKALSIRPDDAYLNVYIAHLYAETGEQDKVIGYLQHGLKLLEDVGLVFATLGNDNFSTRSWNSDEYLKMYESFFDEFKAELQSYATGDFTEDCLESKKLGAFYRSVNKVVVRSLENPDPAVAEYAEKLLEKIKQAGLFKAVSDDEGLELKNSDGEEADEF